MTAKEIYALASKVAWTPCKHSSQCMGVCPVCLWEYAMQAKQGELKNEKSN